MDTDRILRAIYGADALVLYRANRHAPQLVPLYFADLSPPLAGYYMELLETAVLESELADE